MGYTATDGERTTKPQMAGERCHFLDPPAPVPATLMPLWPRHFAPKRVWLEATDLAVHPWLPSLPRVRRLHTSGSPDTARNAGADHGLHRAVTLPLAMNFASPAALGSWPLFTCLLSNGISLSKHVQALSMVVAGFCLTSMINHRLTINHDSLMSSPTTINQFLQP